MSLDKTLRFASQKICNNRFDDENLDTETSFEQLEVEDSVKKIYDVISKKLLRQCNGDESKLHELSLKKDALQTFLDRGMKCLPANYCCLDASRPWLCYWILHTMELLDLQVDCTLKSQIVKFLSLCQDESGGFAGGPGQLPHLAPTYAAVNSLCILGTEEAYSCINREKMYEFMLQLHQPDGSFIMHKDGEVDIRGCYLAASVARLLNIASDDLFNKTPQWIASCQTYEGGFGGVPGMEAHGGYAFCGLAALILLGHERLCDLDLLLRWTVSRQMKYEGGFQGRTNKLVDSCYSFWQSAIIPVIGTIPEYQTNSWMFHNGALQEYILVCCQHPHGGFIDKPGKLRDYYHTCYALSGLSVSQHFTGDSSSPHVVGPQSNILMPVHPVYNLGITAAVTSLEYFRKLPLIPQLQDSLT